MVDELEPNEGTVNYKGKAKESDWDRKGKKKNNHIIITREVIDKINK